MWVSTVNERGLLRQLHNRSFAVDKRQQRIVATARNIHEVEMCEKALIMANGKDSKFNSHKNIIQIDQGDDVWSDEPIKPLANGSEDNWTWSKRHRSQEVILPEPSLRKGTQISPLARRARERFALALKLKYFLFVFHSSLLPSKLE